MLGILQDVKYSFRVLTKSPLFLGMVLLLLCIGTGVNTLVFSVVNAVLLRPLPFSSPDRLYLLWESSPMIKNLPELPVAPVDFLEIRNSNRSFENLAAFRAAEFSLTSTDPPERVAGARISANLFPLLGVQPFLGRTFFPEEEQAGKDNVVVISTTLWKRKFAGDPGIVGKTLSLDQMPYTIVGVMPAGFQFPHGSEMPAAMRFAPISEIWKPLGLTPQEYNDRGNFRYAVLGRLKPGVTITQALTDLNTIVQAINSQQPRHNNAVTARLVPLQEFAVHNVRPALTLLWMASFLVLATACFNVASLMLARSLGVRREIALRAALGAGKRQLVQQVIIESVMLTVAGGLLGFALATILLRLVIVWLPIDLPRASEIHINLQVFAWCMVTSIVTGLLVSVGPAKSGTSGALEQVLRSSGNGTTYSSFGRRFQKALVTFQVMASLVLLMCTLLIGLSFNKLMQVDVGFATDNVLTMQIPLTAAEYPSPEKRKDFFEAVMKNVKSLPGIRKVAVVDSVPLSGGGRTTNTTLRGEPCNSADELSVEYRIVSPEYFQAMGIPIRQGRAFVDQDSGSSSTPAIINEVFAQQCWPAQNPIGKEFKPGRGQQGPWVSVVGVVRDVRNSSPAVDAAPQAYLPYFDATLPTMTMVVQTANDPLSMVSSVQRAIWQVNKHQAVSNVRSTRQLFSETLARQRFEVVLLVFFAVTALSLAGGGVYGVSSYMAAQRGREIGIRIACGADRKSLIRLLVKDAIRPAIIGVIGGSLISLIALRFVRSELYQIRETNPLVLILTSLVLMALSAIAGYIPARRAVCTDPIRVLKQE
jgi:putative ABC transport system permease protein